MGLRDASLSKKDSGVTFGTCDNIDLDDAVATVGCVENFDSVDFIGTVDL